MSHAEKFVPQTKTLGLTHKEITRLQAILKPQANDFLDLKNAREVAASQFKMLLKFDAAFQKASWADKAIQEDSISDTRADLVTSLNKIIHLQAEHALERDSSHYPSASFFKEVIAKLAPSQLVVA